MKALLKSTHARRAIAVLAFALLPALLATLAGLTPLLRTGIRLADNAFYDAFYALRPIEDRTQSDVIIIAVDQRSLDKIDQAYKVGWPWPRQYWGLMTQYLANCGARAVAYDYVFSETSQYPDDDAAFRDALAEVKMPVVFGCYINPDGSWQHFAPPIDHPIFGAVNDSGDKTNRQYRPTVFGRPSLAAAALNAAHQPIRLNTEQNFLLHYYGPYASKDNKHTFRYISAVNVLAAAFPDANAASRAAAPPDLFRGKIILVGGTAVGTYDLKSSPLSPEYPGVEVQATALQNLAAGQQVIPLPALPRHAAALLATLFTAALIIFPRRAILKSLGPALAVAGIIIIAALLFKRADIRWLPPTVPLLAVAMAAVSAFTWTYFAEDRQRKFMLKALSKVVSPAIAEQLAREPGRLALGTTRTQITLLFTDLADFTAVTEAMDVQVVGKFLNRYLGEMSDQVLQHQGTLDKYIGDAIMCFWNAPLPQADHALRACRAAMAIARREDAIRAELTEMGATKVFTRIGINTTDAAVGFVGSSHLFNYTALGDGVNLASRLEGANKLYGSRILLSETTADLVRSHFLLRKLDVLRVKGKVQPMAVYELLAERTPGQEESPLARLAAGYEKALEHYRLQKWDDADARLLELLPLFPHDNPRSALARRIAALRAHPPAADWDGVYDAKEK